MKRIVPIALALALLAATPAGATTRTLEGSFHDDPESAVALRVKHSHGEWSVRAFSAEQILISCQQATTARLSSASIEGRAPVGEKGRFSLRGRDGDRRVKLAGRLVDRRTARGSFHYSGPTEVDGETLDCDSGGLDWSASR